MADDEAPELEADDTTVARARAFCRESRAHYSAWRTEAHDAYAFVAGDQFTEEDAAKLREQLRPVITFNRIGPVLDAVTGWEVSNRQAVRFIPRNEGDAGPNEILTGTADWVRDECDAEDEESDAFGDVLICGLGCVETCTDYTMERDGKIVIERVDPLEVYPDPRARKRNLSDAKRLARTKDIGKEDFEARWPEKVDEISGMADLPADDSESPHDNDPDLTYKRDVDQPAKKGDYRVLEYQWCERVTVYRMIDPATKQETELSAEDYEVVKKRLGVEGLRQSRYRYMRAFICGGTLLEEGENPSQTGFTYKFITGKRDRNSGVWYGLVRPMMDPQRWANTFFSTTLHHMATAGKGIMAERDAFDNVRKAEDKWSSADSIVWTKSGALSGNKPKILPKPSTPLPPGLADLMAFTLQSFREVTGVNTELLGLTDRDQPGIVEAQRKQSGLTILATLFDSLRRYRKEQGRLLLEFINKFLPEGTLVRINQGSGLEKYIPFAKQPEGQKYDTVVDTASTSPNQKEQTWAILQPMLPAVMKMNPPAGIWPVILEASPLPESTVQKLNGILRQPQQAAPDPALVKVQAEAQAEQQRLQLDGMKALGEQKRGEGELQIKQGELTLSQQELQLKARELTLKERELAMREQEGPDPLEQEGKQVEIDAKRAALRKTQGETDALTLENREKTDMQEAVQMAGQAAQVFKQAVAEITQVTQALSQQVQELRDVSEAPREIVRDASGRAAAVKVNGRTRAIARGPDGRVTGLH